MRSITVVLKDGVNFILNLSYSKFISIITVRILLWSSYIKALVIQSKVAQIVFLEMPVALNRVKFILLQRVIILMERHTLTIARSSGILVRSITEVDLSKVILLEKIKEV